MSNFQSDLVLQRLMTLHPKVIDLTLDRVYRLLKRLGNPHTKLPPVVHFAGTNGKGSTQAYMRSALEAAGYRVHAYTSPHLIRFHERIRLAGALISEADLLALLERVEEANGPETITYFEITTVAAILAFAETPADILLLETGLGGRLDATNVVDEPKLSVITPISMDHEAYLGDTLEKIAGEKAGIIKTMSPVCVAPQDEVVLQTILNVADQRISRARALGHNLPWGRLGRRFYVAPKEYPAPGMLGEHQVVNAATAMAALDMLEPEFVVPMPARETAILETRWAGRLQAIPADGLDLELWVDGGHNPAAGHMLAQQLAAWDGPTHLVVGMLNTKAASNYLAPLLGQAASLTTVTIPGEPNSFTADELAASVTALGGEALAAASVEETLARLSAAHPGERVLICGSLYLIGKVMGARGLSLA
jgi:dihydrofolate synthase/folylpolyglutamate synthase